MGRMRAIIFLSLLFIIQISSSSIVQGRFQEPECDTIGGECSNKDECKKAGNWVVEFKCSRQVSTELNIGCCIDPNNKPDGSGVIAADEGISKRSPPVRGPPPTDEDISKRARNDDFVQLNPGQVAYCSNGNACLC